MGWTREQRMVLAILPKISSVFSLFGSIWIIIEVVTEGRKIQNPYHRLLLAMSVYDTLESFWNFGSTWPIVEGSPDIIWAIGNVATCEAQGFFLTLSVAVPIYNAMLSVYYILVINYRYTNTQLRKRVEPIMHFVAFFWSFGTAGYSLATGLFNNANLWCWIAPLPLDCKDTITYGTVEEGNDKPCIRGDNVWVYRFGFYFIPLWFCIFFATACTLWVYRYVLARDRETLKYRKPNRQSHWWNNNQGGGAAAAATSQRSKPNVSSILQSVNTASTKETKLDDPKPMEEEESDDDKAIIADKDESSDDAKEESMVQELSSVRSSVESSATQSSIGKRIDSTGSVKDVFPTDDSNDEYGDGDDDDDDDDIQYEDLKDENDNNEEGDEKQKKRVGDRSSTGKSSTDSVDTEEDFRKINELVASNRDLFGGGEEKQQETFEFDDRRSSDDEDFDMSKNTDSGISESVRKNKSIRERVSAWKNRRVQYAEDMPRTHEVFKQACYYLGAFYCTHIWSTSNRIVQTISGGGTVFPLIACHSFFDPFQGFLNYLVYQRPRFLQLKKKHPEMGWWGIMIKSLRFSFMDTATFRTSKFFGDSRRSRNFSFARGSRNFSRNSSRNNRSSEGSNNFDRSTNSAHFSESKRLRFEEVPTSSKEPSRNSTGGENSEYMKAVLDVSSRSATS